MSEVEQNPELEQVNTEEPGEPAEEPKQEPEPKKELTPEQERGIKQRQLTKLAKELGVDLPSKKEKSEPAEKNEFSDTEQLFLDVQKVPEEDREWLFEEHKSTGKPLRQLVGFRYVQDELKTRLDGRKSENALPEGKNRTGAAPSNSFDYWWAKTQTGLSIKDVPDPKIRKQIGDKRYEDDRRKRGRF